MCFAFISLGACSYSSDDSCVGSISPPLAWIVDGKANRSQICVVVAFPLARDHPSRTSLIHTTPIWGSGFCGDVGGGRGLNRQH